ncbi:MAG: hypothetical protein IJA35_07850 [Clostridia bacterium]|nr:hypothetical protein [Clostridia bacterium]
MENKSQSVFLPEHESRLNETALQLGMQVLTSIAEKNQVSVEDVAESIAGSLENSEGYKNGFTSRAKSIALELSRLNREGKLKNPPESYIADPDFAVIASELGCEQATRVVDNKNDPDKGDIVAKLKSNRSLPQSLRGDMPLSQSRDYANMSSEQFNKLKKQLRNAASSGVSTRL